MFDAELTRWFARQHGLITRSQAGDDRARIEHRLASGRWVRVGAGVYRLAGMPVTWEQRALAACLIAGPGAVVSHRSAAVLLGISGFRPGPLEITVPPGRSARNPLARVHRKTLEPRERTIRDHIPVTHPVRTLVDLARTVAPEVLEEAVDDVLCRRVVRLEDLADEKPLAPVLAAWNGDGALPGSAAEISLVRALTAAGLPPPRRQHWVAAAHARVDLAYPAERIAIELDSFRWHAGTRPFESDRARGNRIVAAGWHLLRAVPGDPEPTISAAARLLRRVA
jgi:hypothetical protein